MKCLLVLFAQFCFQNGALTEEKYKTLGTADAVKKTFNNHFQRYDPELGNFRDLIV